jgi:SAM-dependent methyltransferase
LRLGLDVDRKPLEELDDHSGYDLVVLSHVFEHFGDIARALEKIRSLVRPGGFVFLELPSSEGRVYQGRYGDLPDLYFFAPGNVRLFFQSRGFAVTVLTTLFLPQLKGSVWRRLPKGVRGSAEFLWGLARETFLGREPVEAGEGGDWIRVVLRRGA